MDLLSLIILIVIVGVVMWAINAFIPMEPRIKQVLNVVVIIAIVIFVLSLFIGSFPSIQVGHR